MAWELLPVNYTDAVWSGYKKYNMLNNDDGTISLQDVTVYSHKENSFFGAKDANRMNETLNTIMSMLENGTDLYTAFQNYFTIQQELFKETADNTQADFEDYVSDLKAEGDEAINTIKTDYRQEMNTFESEQQALFTAWFNSVKDQLSEDVAGSLQSQITEIDGKLSNLEYMTLQNDFTVPIAVDDSGTVLLVDDVGVAIVADWKYKEV